MGLAKRARLNAALADPSDYPPAADLSTIRIVRRDKGPASVISLAESRPAGEGAKPAGDGMFYKKGSATAATFRPAYWSYEPDPSQLAGPVASLERQLDARRRSNSLPAAPLEAALDKPLASLDIAPVRKIAPPAAASATAALGESLPTRSATPSAALDTKTVLELLRPLADAAETARESTLTAAAPSTPAEEAMPLAASTISAAPISAPPPLAVDAPSLAPLVAEPASSLPREASAALEATPAAREPKSSALRAGKRSVREASKPAEQDGSELMDSLGAVIDGVLATRWYGAERPSFTAGRVLHSGALAPVTPSGLIAELATVQKETPAAPLPPRRRGRIVAALSLVMIFALAFVAALQWRSGYGSMLPTRLLPALFGAASAAEAAVAARAVALS